MSWGPTRWHRGDPPTLRCRQPGTPRRLTNPVARLFPETSDTSWQRLTDLMWLFSAESSAAFPICPALPVARVTLLIVRAVVPAYVHWANRRRVRSLLRRKASEPHILSGWVGVDRSGKEKLQQIRRPYNSVRGKSASLGPNGDPQPNAG